jgi:ABC-type lipoprotein export system ATPase subunit
VVIATHDNAVAEKADMVISMRDGKLLGKWAEVEVA